MKLDQVAIHDLRESAEILRWLLKKHPKDAIVDHETFFRALIDELNYAVGRPDEV